MLTSSLHQAVLLFLGTMLGASCAVPNLATAQSEGQAFVGPKTGSLVPAYVELVGGVGLNPALETRISGSDFIGQDMDAGRSATLLGGAVGWSVGSGNSVELEFVRATSDVPPGLLQFGPSDIDVEWTTVMVNWIHHSQPHGRIGHYYGGGIGYAPKIKFDLNFDPPPSGASDEGGEGGVAFQAFVGADAQVASHLSAFLEARASTSKASGALRSNASGDTVEVDHNAPAGTLLFGLRYAF